MTRKEMSAWKKIMIPLAGLIILVIFTEKSKTAQIRVQDRLSEISLSKPTVTPVPTIFEKFNQPKIPVKDVYRIALLGDSMTAALGPHGGRFSEYMNTEYHNHANAGIIVDNYAVPSTNIQTLSKRFTEPLEIDKTMYPPIRERKDLDLIILESFGYNPLSHLQPADSILEHHRQVRQFLENVSKELPGTRVVFMSTIAPNKRNYALRVLNISPQDREIQATERIGYLIRHMDIAGTYAIPVIDVYDKSLNRNSDGDLRYIDASDYIHPSSEGIELLSRTMTDFIYGQRILPVHTIPF